MTTVATTHGDASSRPGLRGRAVRASVWKIGGYAASKVLQIGSNVLLSYVIAKPAAWGVMMLAQALLQGLKMFSEVGVGPAIIQSKRGHDPVFLDTGWSIQVLRGFAIWLAGCLLAWPMAELYGEPMLLLLVPVMGLANVFAGLQSTRSYALNREMREGKRTVLEFAERFVTRLSTIGFAFITPTAWSFVWGSLVGASMLTVGSHTYLPGHRNRFRIDRQAAGEMLRFGRWIFVGTVIAFMAQQSDRLLLGGIDDLAVLGIYGIALTVTRLPQELVGVLTQAVFFPLLSELARTRPEEYQGLVTRIRAAVLAPSVATVLAVILGAPWFFRLVYPAAFHDAGWMAPLASLTVWIGVMEATVNRSLLALGVTRPLAMAGLLNVIGTVTGCLVGYRIMGMPGFILGTTFGAACGYAYLQVVVARRGAPVYRQDLVWTLALVVIAGCGVLASRVAEDSFTGVWSIAGGIGASLLVLVPVAAWAAMRTLRFVRPKGKKTP